MTTCQLGQYFVGSEWTGHWIRQDKLQSFTIMGLNMAFDETGFRIIKSSS